MISRLCRNCLHINHVLHYSLFSTIVYKLVPVFGLTNLLLCSAPSLVYFTKYIGDTTRIYGAYVMRLSMVSLTDLVLKKALVEMYIWQSIRQVRTRVHRQMAFMNSYILNK